MITITKRENGFTVEGHAGFAESGKDIVCAGVSTLTQNCVVSIEKLTDDKCIVDMESGFLEAKIAKISANTETLLKSFFIGVEMIANEYPDFVKIN